MGLFQELDGEIPRCVLYHICSGLKHPLGPRWVAQYKFLSRRFSFCCTSQDAVTWCRLQTLHPFPPALSHLRLKIFTPNILRLIRWLCNECNQPMDPAEIHCSPAGLIFGMVWHPICHMITQVQLLIQGWWWKGMARVREESGRASFSRSNLRSAWASKLCL